MLTLSIIGALVLVVALIREIRLKELNLNIKFHGDNEPPKQLKK
jgi:hypothetical protein